MRAFAARAFLVLVAAAVSPPLFHVSAAEPAGIEGNSASALDAPATSESAATSAAADEARLSADLAEFVSIYRLRDGEGFRLIMAQRPRGRHAWSDREFGNRTNSTRPLPEAVYFRWVDGELSVAQIIREEGTLRKLVAAPLGISICQVDGDARLLDKVVPADIIWRPGAPAERLVEQMNAAFAREFRIPVKLSLGEAETDVFVARGEYRYAQDPGTHDVSKARPLLIAAGDGAAAVEDGLDGRGGLKDALVALGDVIGTPVLSEVAAGPEDDLAWYSGAGVAGQADADKVLSAFSSQTNLTFSREKRGVPMLLVEKGSH